MSQTLSILTKDEINDIRGKITTLSKFMKYPRAQLTVLQDPFTHLRQYYNYILIWKDSPHQQKSRTYIDLVFEIIGILENLLIEVVIQGKDFWTVIEEEVKKPGGFFLIYYKINVGFAAISLLAKLA